MQSLKQITKQLTGDLNYKYGEYFNFYFAKSIDLIVDKIRSVVSINFWDDVFYLENQERLKRYYNTQESEIRLHNYSDYYNKLEDYHVPAIENHSQKKIMFWR